MVYGMQIELRLGKNAFAQIPRFMARRDFLHPTVFFTYRKKYDFFLMHFFEMF